MRKNNKASELSSDINITDCDVFTAAGLNNIKQSSRDTTSKASLNDSTVISGNSTAYARD